MQRLPLLVILCISAGLLAWNVGRYAPAALGAEADVAGRSPATPLTPLEVAAAAKLSASPDASVFASGIGGELGLETRLDGGAQPLGPDCVEPPLQGEAKEPAEGDAPGTGPELLERKEPDGSTIRAWTENGLLHGPWEMIAADGQTLAKGEYLHGARAGAWTFWRDDGYKRSVGSYVNGQKQGRWESWHDNGQMERQADYVAGEPHGDYVEWYSDGSLRAKGCFEFGRREGPWAFYDVDGEKDLRSGEYLNGKRVR